MSDMIPHEFDIAVLDLIGRPNSCRANPIMLVAVITICDMIDRISYCIDDADIGTHPPVFCLLIISYTSSVFFTLRAATSGSTSFEIARFRCFLRWLLRQLFDLPV